MTERLRSETPARLNFFRGFLREPQQVGSVIPSSRFLERRVVSLAGIERAQTVVELGPGTGGTTRAALEALPQSALLLTIEIDPQFVSVLRGFGDPRLLVHRGSAVDLNEILARYQLSPPQAVISGIPFSTMTFDSGLRVVEQIREALAPRGYFVAYQIRDRIAMLGRAVFGEVEVCWEYRNIPPARLFKFQKSVEDV